ncbi:MAG: ABC-F family ATP-binding cassette domain-containing protein [Candidatus Diapherotrites archaeon]|nr:ABC-F family ATP-binding cassette domain-containing protein [Candidatus Diapherotrites archaeon]
MALTVRNVSISLGKKDILLDESVGLADGDKVGLIGRNGVGKTTFLKAVLGQVDFNGLIEFNGKAAFFSQESELDLNKTGKELIQEKAVIHHQNEFEKELKELEEQLSKPEIYENNEKVTKLTERYLELQNELKKHESPEQDNKIKPILKLLEVKEEWLEKKISELSTGQKAILVLAQILSAQADFLLLDEPTNHLDFKRLNILEKYLREFKGTVLMVTHDRYFLNQVCNSILRIENGKITKFNGNYSAYIKARNALLEAQKNAYAQEKQYISEQKDKIARIGKSPLKVKQAQYREKLLERRESIEKPMEDKSKFRTPFQAIPTQTDVVLSLIDLTVGYDKPLISDINLNVGSGQRIILIGENGAGKSTLIKTIEGRLPKISGKIVWDPKSNLGYADQELKDLTGNATLYDEINALFKEHSKTRQQLGMIGFNSDEDIFKPINKLSTGEKSRLNLLKILIKQPNLLLLDEPTNHLDLDACEIIENAFLNYNGAILAISHDKYFIEKIGQRILKVENGKIKEIKKEEI